VRAFATAAAVCAVLSLGGCASGSTAAADPRCPSELTAGNTGPLPGHAPSKSPKDALTLFLKLNSTAPPNPSPDLTRPDFLGQFKLPVTDWVRVRSPKWEAVYEHRAAGSRSDFQVVMERTGHPDGWSVSELGRCG
jgi:hypothetical protein